MKRSEARVLGAGPFREIGQPRVTANSPNGDLIAVGGDLGWPQWHGRDIGCGSGPHPLAVYRTDDLTCVHQVTARWPVHSIAFHPTLPLVAIGTGSYDGGWSYEGELLLLDLTAGIAVSLLEYPREVRRVAWRSPQMLDLVLAIPCDPDEQRFGTTSLACSISRDDWDRAVVGMLQMPYGEQPVPDEPSIDTAAAVATVSQLCRRRGQVWAARRGVWAVEALADGRILTALEGVGLECWSGTSAELLWQVPTDRTGYQIRVLPGDRTALVLTQVPRRYGGGRSTQDPSGVLEIDLDDGTVRKTHESSNPALLVGRIDGSWALRDTDHDRRSKTAGEVTFGPPADAAATIQLGPYDLFNHFFDIRYAPDLLFLQGRRGEPWRDKWVVAVDVPTGRVRQLFPLEWDTLRGGHLFGGVGAYLDDRAGPSLVHTGAVHNGGGRLPGNAVVVRRRYLTGELQWIFTADREATALDADDTFVYVVFNTGELVVLRTEDGNVHARHELRIAGHPVVPLSLRRIDVGRLAIGTLDGQVLVVPVPAAVGEVAGRRVGQA
ncbi:hypothetical protein [Micromonospora sp. NPDC005203]|uniref:hypothetical protein n=1 Tax=Micromonospora sp. NPDC005203 TaxID=3364226 RepID=UPI00367A24A7